MLAVVFSDLLIGSPGSWDAVAGANGSGGPHRTLAALFVVNGLGLPVVEELAWRGVIQTALLSASGTLVGCPLTAGAFVLKHVVELGAAPIRLASLVILGTIRCGLRARDGTASSTVTHLGLTVSAP